MNGREMFLSLLGVLIALTVIAGWGTHVAVCIQQEAWVMLGFGAIVAPIGIVHGWLIWAGVAG